MKFKIWMLLLGLLSINLYAERSISLSKVFHHRVSEKQDPSDATHHIEIGSLGIYFDHEPRVESSIVPKKDITHHVLFIPNAEIQSDEVKRAIRQINDRKGLGYSVSITEVKKPQPGVQIMLVYSPHKVGFKYDFFDSISMKKGLLLRFYNKDILKKISEKEKGIITTASLSPRVYIDCGHGGIDAGAVAHSVKEKDVNLAIGQKTAALLKKKGVAASLSRNHDLEVAIDARTTQANSLRSDVFVSIHANSSSNCHTKGIETFALSPHLFKRGDAFLTPSEFALTNQALIQRCALSNDLALQVHEKLIASARKHCDTRDRSIKKAASQVLIGAQMPGILVEVGFVTHPHEATLLSQKNYQEELAASIAAGILSYLKIA